MILYEDSHANARVCYSLLKFHKSWKQPVRLEIYRSLLQPSEFHLSKEVKMGAWKKLILAEFFEISEIFIYIG